MNLLIHTLIFNIIDFCVETRLDCTLCFLVPTPVVDSIPLTFLNIRFRSYVSSSCEPSNICLQ